MNGFVRPPLGLRDVRIGIRLRIPRMLLHSISIFEFEHRRGMEAGTLLSRQGRQSNE